MTGDRDAAIGPEAWAAAIVENESRIGTAARVLRME
jgi:hypothetical protein